jgi:hypothetical protein
MIAYRSILLAALTLAACAEYLGTSFSEIAPPEISGREVRPGGRCWLEKVNGAPPGAPWPLSRQYRAFIQGWALDGATLSSSGWLIVRLTRTGGDQRYYALTSVRAARPDVARELGAAAASARPGFDLAATLQQVPPGTYDIDIVVGTPTGPVSCATGQRLIVV